MRRWIAVSGAVAVVLAAGAAGSRAALAGSAATITSVRPLRSSSGAIDGSILLRARYATATRGTFSSAGAVVDAGTFKTTRRTIGGRLELTETFVGKAGVMRVRVTRRCRATSGAWIVLSGSASYAGLTGGGTVRGAPRCVGQRYPTVASHTGAVRTPPPPELATPGAYGGGTAQRREVKLDVREGGRTLANFRTVVISQCQGTSITPGEIVIVRGPVDIAEDRTFSFQPPTTRSSVSGRFTSATTAEGTVTVQSTLTTSVGTYECSGTTTWRVSLPPPAATPGQYCGYTNQGTTVCLDVDSSGKTVTRIDVGVVVLCNQRSTEVEVRMSFSNLAIGGHLGFVGSSSSLPGLISGTGLVGGLLDPDGGTGAHGSARIQLPVFDYEGSRYTCGVAETLWEARRQ